jgi:hypothetical protein
MINPDILAEPVHNLLKFNNLLNLHFFLHHLLYSLLGIGRLLSIWVHHILRVMQGHEVFNRRAVAFLAINS